jgi:hypothetical protein
MRGDAQHLFVHFVPIPHAKKPNGPDIDPATRKSRFIYHNQGVKGVVVLCVGLGEEAVFTGVVNSAVQYAIQAKKPGLFVQFILVAASAGNFDHYRHFLGWTNARFQLVPGMDHQRFVVS